MNRHSASITGLLVALLISCTTQTQDTTKASRFYEDAL